VSVEIAAGVVLIAAPLWFNANFALLGKRLDYPDILRRPTAEVLERFRAGGSSLILLWWTFMLSALFLIAGVVLLGQVLGYAGVVSVAVTIGVLAGLVQMLGLLLWVYVVPALARGYADSTLGPEQREAHAVVFRALHQYRRGRCRRAPGLPLYRHLVRVDRRRYRPGNRAAHVAGVARDGHRRGTDGWLGGVPRAERKARMEARRSSDLGPLHRVVALVAGVGHRVDYLISLPQEVARGQR